MGYRLAFVVDDPGHEIDFSGIENGNPGVGGTLYHTILMAWYLKKNYNSISACYILCKRELILPSGLSYCCVEDFEDAINWSENNNVDYLVIIYFKSLEDKRIADQHEVKIIAWPSIYISPHEAEWLADCDAVKRVVWVGRQQRDFYLDHNISKKSLYIYNPLYIKADMCKEREQNYKRIVTYVGGLYPQKGFHVLAKMWPHILKCVPDAQLYVCGSGRLYDKNTKQGKYGIADEAYEKRWVKYITDKEGEIMPSIHFLGTVDEKTRNEILSVSSVGVVNPTAKTETFCNSAVEIQAHGVPVVTKQKLAFLDTVPDNVGGLTSMTNIGMRRRIVLLLTDRRINDRLGASARKFVNETFDISKSARKWMLLLQELSAGGIVNRPRSYSYWWKDMKWLKIFNMRIRELLKKEQSAKWGSGYEIDYCIRRSIIHLFFVIRKRIQHG